MKKLRKIETSHLHCHTALSQATRENDDTENHKFTWRIEGFDQIQLSPKALELHQFTFEIGNKISLPTSWKCGLWSDKVEDEDWIGIQFTLENQNAPLNNPGALEALLMHVEVKLGQQSIGKLGPSTIEGVSGNKSIRLMRPLEKGRYDDNGCLCLDICIYLSNLKSVLASGQSITFLKLTSEFKNKFNTKLQQDLKNMYENLGLDIAVSPGIITMISCDGQKIIADRAILAARSPVFSSMFQIPMLEAEEGVVKVEDISGPALNALVSFMHTGTLPENWQDAEIIGEFIYGAHKYMLEDLQEYLAKVVGFLCTEDNWECMEKLENMFSVSQTHAKMGLVNNFRDQLNIG